MSIDQHSMPMELHAVHYKSDYETQVAALRQNGGITILVYLFQVLKEDFFSFKEYFSIIYIKLFLYFLCVFFS